MFRYEEDRSMRIATASIGLPDPYIRKNTNNERINMWVEQIRASAQDYVKANEGVNGVEAILKCYFLPKIHVMRLTQSQTMEFTGPDRKKHTKTVGYRVLDGVHRLLTTGLLGLDSIDCEEHPPMSPAQAYALQFKLNNEGPLPFNRETRDNAIRQMAKFKVDGKQEMTLAQIAVHTGISEGQVSRIVSMKSGRSAEEISDTRKKAASKGKRGARAKGGYDAKAFFDAVKAAARECSSHVKVLREYLTDHDKVWEPCEDLIETLASLRGVAVELVPENKV
jgi:hypothetical protein